MSKIIFETKHPDETTNLTIGRLRIMDDNGSEWCGMWQLFECGCPIKLEFPVGLLKPSQSGDKLTLEYPATKPSY